MFIINFCLNMFRASSCPSSEEQRPCYCIWCTVLVLLDVVGSGCGALHCRMQALWRLLFDLHSAHILQRSTPQPLPTTSSRTSTVHHKQQHGLCSPEDGHNDARNMLRQKLIINIWLLHLVGFPSLFTLSRSTVKTAVLWRAGRVGQYQFCISWYKNHSKYMINLCYMSYAIQYALRGSTTTNFQLNWNYNKMSYQHAYFITTQHSK